MTKLLVAATATITLYAQTPAKAPLKFEVAAVKATVDNEAPGRILHLAGERGYHGTNMALMDYIRVAYQLRFDQISGPAWLTTEHFDLEAKAEHTSTADELHEMLQHLLEDRFHIQLHRETRQENGFALLVDTGGPKLTAHDPANYDKQPLFQGSGPHKGVNVTMQYLAFFLSQEVGQTVVDRTGLTGNYDFQATWGSEGPMMVPMRPGPPGPGEGASIGEAPAVQVTGLTVFEALRKQLGLRLDKMKVPAPHLIIDHIESLSDN